MHVFERTVEKLWISWLNPASHTPSMLAGVYFSKMITTPTPPQPLLLNEGMKEERERGGCPGVLLRKPIPQSWHSICGPPLKQTWAIFPGPCNAPGGITDFSLISVNIIGGKILKITRPKLITTVSFGSVWKCVYVMSTNLPTSAEDR